MKAHILELIRQAGCSAAHKADPANYSPADRIIADDYKPMLYRLRRLYATIKHARDMVFIYNELVIARNEIRGGYEATMIDAAIDIANHN